MAHPILSTAAEAWRHLVTTAGLDPKGYDEPLVLALSEHIGLGPSSRRDIARELEDRHVSIEEFLVAFFRAMRPYGDMLRDLLEMFTEAGAKFGDHNLAVQFDFERGIDLGFNLDQFRQWLAQWTRASASVSHAQWSPQELWKLVHLLRRSQQPQMTTPEFQQWRFVYREQRRWPIKPVAPLPTGDTELDELLRRVWRLWEVVLRESARKARDRDDLAQQWFASRRLENPPNTEIGEDDRWPVHVLAALDSDLWLEALLEGILATSQEARSRQRSELSLIEIKSRLRELFASVPAASVQHDVLVLKWQAYLDLPLWKRRHELYSAWVSSQILGATAPIPRQIHCEDGVLRFAFSGSHVASLQTPGPKIHLWAELRWRH